MGSDFSIAKIIEFMKGFQTAPAILAPGRKPLSHANLCDHIEYVVSFLHKLGIGRNDRIGVILPNGPEMAATFLSVITCATFVPLNPAYKEHEYDFALTEMKVKVLILEAEKASPARNVAGKKKIPIIELIPQGDAKAGLFRLECHKATVEDDHTSGLSQPDDIALLLQTSGTTSRPKIVPLTVANIISSAQYIIDSLHLQPSDRCLNIMSMFHIAGLVSPVLASLIAGGSVICTQGFSRDRFFDWICEYRPTWYSAVPTIHKETIEISEYARFQPEQNPLRFIRSISFSIPPSVSQRLEDIFHIPVIQTYGMTEALPITSSPFPPSPQNYDSVGIAAGPDVAVMNAQGRILEPGDTGEIVVRGPNVTKGYEDNPGANEKSFVSGWFKTGDLGYMDKDGYLYIRGRLKEIINRGGQKVSPYEIEEILEKHPAVVDIAAFGVPHHRLGEAVVAAVVAELSQKVTEEELRASLSEQLTGFKVPQQIIFVDSIPRGPSGKIRRDELPGTFAHLLRPDFVPPETETETMVSRLWGDVLGVEKVGKNDNFFTLGGDSLLATQVVARLGTMLGTRFPVKVLFEHTTLGKFARAVTEVNTDNQRKDFSAGSEFRPAAQNMIPPDNREKLFPLSCMQQRLWFLDQGGLSEHAYIVSVAIRIQGSLEEETLERSINEVIRRHDILRTAFTVHNGIPYQEIMPNLSLTLRIVNLDHIAESERESEALALILKELKKPFDLAQGPLLRAVLLRIGENHHILHFAVHHIIFDQWSTGILFNELSELYTAFAGGSPSPLPALPVQYADYAQWQRQWLQGEVLGTQLFYWKKQLYGAPPLLKLPTDKPRPSVQTYRGARLSMEFSPDLSDGIISMGHHEGVTTFMTLLAAFNILLFRYAGQEDIVIGTPIANRSRVETEKLIGFFVNTLALRSDLSGNPTFREFLTRVRETVLAAHDYQDLPLEKLVEELQPERNLNHAPLFQVMFTFQNSPVRGMNIPGLSINRIRVDSGSAKYDLVLFMEQSNDGLTATMEYNTDLFEAGTIQRMLCHLQILLQGIIEDPDRRLSELPLLPEEEKHRILVEWNKTEKAYPGDTCVHEFFEVQAAQRPEAIAVAAQARQLTYSELNNKASQLAQYLIKKRVKPGAVVAVCMERSPEMIMGLIAILKAGASYVPLDPAYPKERLAFMLQDSHASLLLTQSHLREIFLNHAPEVICIDSDAKTIAKEKSSEPVHPATPHSPAYVIYTSGSTGSPKGVVIPHRAIVRLILNTDYIQLTSSDRVAQISNMSFDAATFEIWGALLHGACLEILSKDTILSPEDFASRIQKRKISVIFMTTALLNIMAHEQPAAFRSLRYLLFGGEAADPGCVRKILGEGPPGRLLHMYGPTESTTFTTWYPVRNIADDAATIPIGKPIANTTVYLLDQYLQPVPAGVAGEVFIGGDGLAEGYLNNPGLTEEKFVSDPFRKQRGARLYRTGDLARYLPDGNIEFLGRMDNQVKIRGFRVEPGEIETILRQHPDVRDSTVIAAADKAESKRLIAYVLSVDHASLSPHGLRDFLVKKLPEHMIPSRFVLLDSFPITPNGKVDRQALATMEVSQPEPETTVTAPKNTLERQLVRAWERVLNLPEVGTTDNFFALGGHSLLAVQVMAEVKKETGQNIPVIALFQSPTIQQLAETIEKGDWPEKMSSPIQINPDKSKVPLFWLHDTFLAKHLEPDQPLYVVRHWIPDEEITSLNSVEERAAHYLKEVRSIRPKGPYVLGGYCFSSVVALEMARQMIQQGDEVPLLFLVEPSYRLLPPERQPAGHSLKGKFTHHGRKIAEMGSKEKMSYISKKLPLVLPYFKDKFMETIKLAVCKTYLLFRQPLPAGLQVFYNHNCYVRQALVRYTPEVYPGSIVIFQPEKIPEGIQRDWKSIASGKTEIHEIPGAEHLTIIQEPYINALSQQLTACIDQIQGKISGERTMEKPFKRRIISS